jgi:DNA-directed RNA polymerase III subunit RPC8
MYVLVELQDKLKILPEQFDRDTAEVLAEQIDIKYSNKVMLDIGLCVCFYDFIEVQDAYVYPGEGSCHQVVKFRMVVFRPFIGETITGHIQSSDVSGIRVTMGFFSDIFIPSSRIRQPASYNPNKKCWTWHYIHDEGSDDFPLAVGDEIRFKVQDCVFTMVTASMKERRVTLSTTTALTNGAAASAAGADANTGSSAAGSGSGSGVLGQGGRRTGGFFGVTSGFSFGAGAGTGASMDHIGTMSTLSGGSSGILTGGDGASTTTGTGAGAPSFRRQRSSSNVGIVPSAGMGVGVGAPGLNIDEPPMQIIGDISCEDGLGSVDWW